MIIAPDQLPILREREGRGLVLVAGVFDPLHAGHLAYFDKARAFGPLVCAVASDAYIRTHKHRPPILPQAERMALLDRFCEYVIAQDETGEAGALDEIRPATYAKGIDWLDKLPEAEHTACVQFGIPAVFLEGARVDSSSARLKAYQQAYDANAVDRLEAFVQQQTPATEPWRPVTPYDFEARTLIEGSHPALIVKTFAPQHVIDVGCGPARVLSRLLRKFGVTVTAVDKEDDYGESTLDITRPIKSDLRGDLVICRELIEHLTVAQIARAIRNLVALSSRFVYLTCRLHPDPSHLLDVLDHDDLDPDHRTLLNENLLRLLFVLEGCTRRADLEAAMDWQRQGRVLVYEVP